MTCTLERDYNKSLVDMGLFCLGRRVLGNTNSGLDDMFENLSDRLGLVIKNLKGQGRLSEKNIQDALREVRMSLLEADVNFSVVKDFLGKVRVRATGEEVMKSLTPGQMFVKVVNEELTELMGGVGQELVLTGKSPVPIMFVGLQGSGKTTSVGKTAAMLRKKGRRPLLVPADVYRPAAIEQLKKLAADIDMPAFDSNIGQDPVSICELARDEALKMGYDILLIDTAGRLQIDEKMMLELQRIKSVMKPSEVLFVADAMTGQEAVNVAKSFNDQVGITGVVLTKMDSDARGGAALSIKTVTGAPIKLVGVGEKLDALEVFHPDRMAGRILGMGDLLTLIEKAEGALDEEKAAELERKLRKNEFTLDDFRDQLKQVRGMGSLDQLMSMIPGMNKMKGMAGMEPDENELVKIDAMISSMTKEERRNHQIINGSRRRRIARGSGTTVPDINNLLKQYTQMNKMVVAMAQGGGIGVPGMGGLRMPKMKGMGKMAGLSGLSDKKTRKKLAKKIKKKKKK